MTVSIPPNTIAIINNNNISDKRIENLIYRPSKKRDWFTPHFYNCLPLSIANQHAYVINTEYSFSFSWNGGSSPNDIQIEYHIPENVIPTVYPKITSHFGSGIITVECPFIIKTPEKVNIMTINPPNYILPNLTSMNGVVETDNLRFTFTFNLKIQEPNIVSTINANSPIAAFIPIPRGFADRFEIKNAKDILHIDDINEEISIYKENLEKRQVQSEASKLYLKGMDIRGNIFNDHQRS